MDDDSYVYNLDDHECGNIVSLTLLDSKEAHMGIFLGCIKVAEDTYNPLLYVPELKTCVFGYDCWWTNLSNPTAHERE